MSLDLALIYLLACVLYPMWLVAGAVDYLCHRRTLIEATAGVGESDYHVAQYATMAVIVAGAALFTPSTVLTVVLAVAVVLHTVLAYLDVKYTQPRRFISPLEQQAHAFMEILPIVAVMLLAVLGFESNVAGVREVQWPSWLIVASFILIAGTPVFEERWRTSRTSQASKRLRTIEVRSS